MSHKTKDLDHDLRNPLMGILLEVRRISKSAKRIERFTDRMDVATEKSLRQWAKELSDNGPTDKTG